MLLFGVFCVVSPWLVGFSVFLSSGEKEPGGIFKSGRHRIPPRSHWLRDSSGSADDFLLRSSPREQPHTRLEQVNGGEKQGTKREVMGQETPEVSPPLDCPD